MTTALKALLFDVDGTLAETEEVHRAAFNEAFAESGIDWQWDQPLYHELLRVTGGKERIAHFVERSGLPQSAFPFERIAALHQLKTKIYTRMVDDGEIALCPGIEALIKEARGSGLVLAITTTTSRVNVERLLCATLGAESLLWFAAYVTGERVRRKKPDPEVYQVALDELGLSPGACLALEDAPQGLAAARAAGIATVVLESAYSCGADFDGALEVIRLAAPRPTLADLQATHQRGRGIS